MNGPDLAVKRLLAERSAAQQRGHLFHFLWRAFQVLHEDRGEKFVANWHLKAMCYWLERVANGDVRRLLITMPPRHLKTVTTSVAFVAWLIGHNPSLRIIIASYGHLLSQKNLNDLRRLFESAAYKRLFPDVRVHVAGSEIRTNRGGSIRATSVGGTITGIGADYIIADDLLKAGDATSPQMRDDAYNFYQHSLVSRLDDKSKGRIILVQQRLHADDVAGRLLDAGGFEHLNLPAIAEDEQAIPIGPNEVHVRRIGDVLFPQREPLEVLDNLRREMGSHIFVPQYQQRTDGAGSDLFKWSWLHSYVDAPRREELNMVVQSVDTAFSDNATSDWSVCMTFGRKGQDWYVLDVLRTRDSYSDLARKIAALTRRWKTDHLLIEAAGVGITLCNELRREHNVLGVIRPIPPRLSKQERFDTQIERLKNGRFFAPEDAPWLHELRRELVSFPNGRHDDQVDALTQFLKWLGNRSPIAHMREFEERARR